MKIVRTEKAVEGDILAKDISNKSGIILIPAGTVLKREYIMNLLEIGENFIYINSKDENRKLNDEQAEIITEECIKKMEELIEKYISSDNGKLSGICCKSKSIIECILKKPQVINYLNIIRRNDMDIYYHSLNVCTMSVMLALNVKLDDAVIIDIAAGSILHDIGYEFSYSNIASCKLRNIQIDEEKEIKRHVIYGYSMLKNEKWLGDIGKDIVLSHHEKIDGSGYPMGIDGNKIKRTTGIVSICNMFDNLINKNNKKVNEAVDIIVGESGTTFDSDMVNKFIEIVQYR